MAAGTGKNGGTAGATVSALTSIVYEPRVVIADDSAIMRVMISDLLEEAGCKIVAFATNGIEAVNACKLHKPDVLTLDLLMPGLDGLGVLDQLSEMSLPTKVVVVSSFSTSLVERAVDVLSRGATEVVRKPAAGVSFGDFTREITDKVLIAGTAVKTPNPPAPRFNPDTSTKSVYTPLRDAESTAPILDLADTGDDRAPRVRAAISSKVLVLATSTGGPRALGVLVPQLPAPLGKGGVVIQHMPAGFTQSLARRLDATSRLHVREAEQGDSMTGDQLLVAKAGQHLRFTRRGRADLSSEAAIGGIRPRADLTIEDLVKIHGANVVLVVLTGMGRDALEGAQAVKAAGGTVIAQTEADCTVYGMPRHVIEADLADAIVTLDDMPDVIYDALMS